MRPQYAAHAKPRKKTHNTESSNANGATTKPNGKPSKSTAADEGEIAIQASIKTALECAGIFVCRNSQIRRGHYAGGLGPGSPDLVVCHQGRFIGLEVKTPKTAKDTSEAQVAWAARFRRAGGRYYVVTSAGEALLSVYAA